MAVPAAGTGPDAGPTEAAEAECDGELLRRAVAAEAKPADADDEAPTDEKETPYPSSSLDAAAEGEVGEEPGPYPWCRWRWEGPPE